MPGCSSPPVISASSDEPLAADRVVGVLLEDLLERHLAVQLGVEGHEDLAQAAPRMRPQHAEPLAVAGGRADGVAGGAVGVVVVVGGRAVLPSRPGRAWPRFRARRASARLSRVERPAGTAARLLLDVAAVCLEVQAGDRLDDGPLRRLEVAAGSTRWSARLGPCRGSRPGRRRRAGPGRSGRSEGEQSEEEMAVGGDGGHDLGLPKARRGPWAPGRRRRCPPPGQDRSVGLSHGRSSYASALVRSGLRASRASRPARLLPLRIGALFYAKYASTAARLNRGVGDYADPLPGRFLA